MRYIIGIDEVGRGALAGPVAVAAVAMPKNLGFKIKNLGKLRDSKKLTPLRRELWFEYFKNHPQITYSLARVYPRVIERKNISKAANTAALRALTRLCSKKRINPRKCLILLDGGLYVGNSGSVPNARTVIKGDERFATVKIASIIAKVSRDRFMKRLAKKYPRYGFEVHKGYGTKMHFRAIRKHGPSPAHRLTFLRFS